jgi:membrane protein implicated in regulation of membrane protease activity
MASIAPLQSLVDPATLPLLLVAAGLGLSIAEAFAPGAHFIVLGLALLAAGLVGLLIGPFASPLVLGVLVLVFGGLALYGYREFDLYGGRDAGQTRDSDSLTGRVGRVTERVTPTAGEVKLEEGGFNPFYAARSVDGEIPEGTEVMVVDPGGGNVVTVESLSGGLDDIDRELARERARREASRSDGGGESGGDATTGGTREAERERETE